MAVFEHGVNACGSIAAVMAKLGSGVGGLGVWMQGAAAREQLGRAGVSTAAICSVWGPSPRQRIVMGQAGAHRADLR